MPCGGKMQAKAEAWTSRLRVRMHGGAVVARRVVWKRARTGDAAKTRLSKREIAYHDIHSRWQRERPDAQPFSLLPQHMLMPPPLLFHRLQGQGQSLCRRPPASLRTRTCATPADGDACHVGKREQARVPKRPKPRGLHWTSASSVPATVGHAAPSSSTASTRPAPRWLRVPRQRWRLGMSHIAIASTSFV